MSISPKIIFKNLKSQIADAIKESCYKSDARLYNVANEVRHIPTFNFEPGVDILDGLSKITDKTIKESVGLGCDLSVIVTGIMIGSFRSSPLVREEAQKTIGLLMKEILQFVFKYKGDVKQTVEGMLASIVIIAKENKLNVMDVLKIAQEDMLSTANALSPEFADDIRKFLPKSDTTPN